MLTNDRLNAERGKEEKLDCANLRQYAEEVHPHIIDKIAGNIEEKVEIDKNINYPPHLSASQILVRIKGGTLKQGKLQISRDNYLEGILLDGDKEILIQGRNDLNRAMNEDIVAVRIKPESEWSSPR
jgi:exosome complex exonuclease DIS3/RRP44